MEQRSVSIPDLYCPFPTRISPHVHQVQEQTDRWMKEFSLLPDEKAYAGFSNYKMAWMTCRTMPDASLDLLVTVNNFYSWLFVMDEQLDHITPETEAVRDKRFLQHFISGFVRIMRENSTVSKSDNLMLAAFSDIWQQLQPHSRATWQCQFTVSLKGTFEAAIWEAANTNALKLPTVAQYTMMRPYFSGANLGTDLNEVAQQIFLPVYVLQNESIIQLVNYSRRVVCWANDLFSLGKELAHGDNHNLVMVLKENHQLSLEEAIREAAGLHDREIRRMRRLRSRLPDFGEKVNDDVQRYINGLETMVAGFFYWSIEDTPRYSDHKVAS